MPTGGRTLPGGDVPVAECYVCCDDDAAAAAAAAAAGSLCEERSLEMKEGALCSQEFSEKEDLTRIFEKERLFESFVQAESVRKYQVHGVVFVFIIAS